MLKVLVFLASKTPDTWNKTAILSDFTHFIFQHTRQGSGECH